MKIMPDYDISFSASRPAPKTITVTIQIGNSDDKLTQIEWSNFVNSMRSEIVQSGEVHFEGSSRGDARWQNHCWVVAIPSDLDQIHSLKERVEHTRKNYRQDCAAFTAGETLFV